MQRTIVRWVASFKIHSSSDDGLGALRRPVGRFHAELLGVFRVQPVPAVNLHRVGTDHSADGSCAEKSIQNVETDVPPGSTHGDKAPINVVPQRQARAAAQGFEFPPQLIAAPIVLENLGSFGSPHVCFGNMWRGRVHRGELHRGSNRT
jgi:hypothetical protein